MPRTAFGKWISGWQPRTLRRGMILVVVAALLPLVIVSIIQSAIVLESVRTQIGNRLSASARAIAEREGDSFIIARHSLGISSRRASIITMSESCTAALQATLEETRPAVVNYARTDANARPKCSARSFDPNQDYSQTEWWKRAMADKELTVSKPLLGPISKEPVILMVLPMKKPDGTLDGAVSAAISLDSMQKSLNRSVSGTNATAAIVSEAGETLLSSNRVRLTGINTHANGALGQATDKTGESWVYSVAPLERQDLFVVYAEPRTSSLSPSTRQMAFNMLLPILAIILASLAIWFGTHQLVVRWLKRLGVLARHFADGDLSGNEASFAKAPEEITALSNDLHEMARAIEARDNELLAALDTKTALTREIHHRVKNNLQIVMSLLTLQASRIEDEEVATTLAQTRARIAALALIHRLMYQQEEKEEASGSIDLGDLMSELATQLRTANREYANVDLICNVGEYPVALDYAVPLSLFTVEAVTNAYRHGFADGRGGAISLTLDRNGEGATLHIDDNGSGFDVNSRAGQMGTDLMHAFASQVNGSYSVDSSESGTAVTLRFSAY